jgi:5-methylcytosine-specific restriction protein A
MGWGFEIGRVYNRRNDIHGRFGGQQQGGIITPSQHPVVIIITGEEGLEHGYADRYRPDGAFEYFGEGQVGDMQLQRGNRAIAEHSAFGTSLLLFRKTDDGLRFEGEMVYEGHHVERAPDRTGTERNAIVFELRPLEAITEAVETETEPSGISLHDLRERAFATASTVLQPSTQGMRNVYQRSRDVRDYVLARANGNCEGCTSPAPFSRSDGKPYLEPHHLRRLSDGGPDHPAHVIALCPNCHRRVHFGADGQTYNATLIAAMSAIEPEASPAVRAVRRLP